MAYIPSSLVLLLTLFATCGIGKTDTGDTGDCVTPATWYVDADSDGFGGVDDRVACEQPSGYVTNNEDCNDSDAAINPDAAEICNDVDDDCDGAGDRDAVDAPTWYVDIDDDWYGDAKWDVTQCNPPDDGFVTDNTDCDDRNADVNPGETEVCNDIDDNCDGRTDDGCSSHIDLDGDGYYEDGSDPTLVDCDDYNPLVYPGAMETVNGIDDDCDGEIDEG